MTQTSEPFGSLGAQEQALLDAVGPVWAQDINRHRDLVVRTYTPLVQQADNAGIEVLRDQAYGAAPRQRLDVYARAEWQGERRDVLLFFHGGAFIRGNKSANGAIYDNVAYWFARQGCVAVNVEYRLAPDAPYPAGAEDVLAALRWVRQNIERFGGDARRIFLMGHSAGGAHVASALLDPAVAGRPRDGEVAGAMLVSARLRADVLPDNPNAGGVRAYFGADESLYARRSPASHVGTSNVPLLVAVAQYENPHLDRYGQEFYEAALASARTAETRFTSLPRHNHTSIVAHFNSGEETLGPQILQFMRDTR
ncbi:MAG: alpha/beta hydrolase fold domain-containing protein [Proteobacteria bacterium]|nr:alpha/beta hydrolase fold domain-containing protein [Pseudomonadota bacterium]